MTDFPLNQVICGDCLQVMKEFPDESIDLIVTDPPYNVSSEFRFLSKNPKFVRTTELSDFYGEWDVFTDEQSYWNFIQEVCFNSVRVLRKGKIFAMFFDKKRIGKLKHILIKNYHMKFKDMYLWIKTNPTPQIRKVGWMSSYEMVLMMQKPGGKLTYNWKLGQHKNYTICSNITRSLSKKLHPVEKPQTVISPLIKWWSNENDIVLDPMCGSGVVCTTAKKLKRQYIGIDSNPKYCEISRKQLSLITSMNELEKFFGVNQTGNS